jgi:hypothetical protein
MAGRPFSWLGNHITSADVHASRSFCISSWRWTVLRLTIYIWGIKGSRDERDRARVGTYMYRSNQERVRVHQCGFRTEGYFSINL